MIHRRHAGMGYVVARARWAFTTIELATIIVIAGVLSAIAIPLYLDYRMDATASACKGALTTLRAAIANYHTYSLTAAGGTTPSYPAISDLTNTGTLLKSAIPQNPFDRDDIPNNIEDATGQAKGTIIGSNGGWCYDPMTGRIWANTLTGSARENRY